MAIVRWNPLDDIVSFQRRMNKLFEDTFLVKRHPDEEFGAGIWSPAVDIYETESDIVLKAELPEVDQKDIEIKIDENVLTLKGERRFEKETKEENYHRMERFYGSFSRSFTLPSGIEQEKIKAQYKDGVLKITMPKKAETKSKKITVEINSKIKG